MSNKRLYLCLCVLGTCIPLTQFFPWVLEHGFNIPLFINELFETRIGAFFGLDVLISALVLFVFIYFETAKLKIDYVWAAVLATLCVGVSLGLPLFLYFRQRTIEQSST